MAEKPLKTASGARAPLDELTRMISKLDPSTRSSVAKVLRLCLEMVASDAAGRTSARAVTAAVTSTPRARIVRGQRGMTPGDNVLFCAAQLYQERGAAPVSVKDIKDRALQLGLTLPTTPSNTLRFVKQDERPMFTCNENGWELTRAGEKYMRETYPPRRSPVPARSSRAA